MAEEEEEEEQQEDENKRIRPRERALGQKNRFPFLGAMNKLRADINLEIKM